MSTLEQKHTWFLDHFELLEKGLNGESKSEIHAIRKGALARFNEVGFPAVRDEEWRFTNIAPIRTIDFAPAPKRPGRSFGESDVESLFVTSPSDIRLVFVNGCFSEELSSVPPKLEGAIVCSLSSAIHSRHPAIEQYLAHVAPIEPNSFVALSTAFIQDGAFVCVNDGVSLGQAIECLYVTSGGERPFISNPRNLFVFGNGSNATIIEQYASSEDTSSLNNIVTEVVVGEKAIVEHDKLEMENANAFHVSTIQIRQAAGSKYTSNAFSLGGKIVRNNIVAVLADQHAEATLNGLSLATGEQLMDSHTVIDHTMPNCASHELYKSILDGKARGVFNGKIFVRPDAQKTDAKQTNKTLLLSDDAIINTKPQLEIFADDVKCTHGAAVGQLDEEQIFYLRSRGIGERAARDILTLAFASDVVDRVGTDFLREKLRGVIQRRLEEARNSKG